MEGFYKNIEEKFLAADEFIDNGDVKGAKELLEAIVMEDPTYGRAHNHLGWIYGNHFSDYKRAERHLKMAIKYAPDYPSGYRNYAQLLLDVSKTDELFDLCNRAMKVPGVNRAAMHRYLGIASEMRKDFREAYLHFLRSRESAFDPGWFDTIKDDMKRLRTKMGFLPWLALRMSRKR